MSATPITDLAANRVYGPHAHFVPIETARELETLAGELAEALKAVVNSAVDPEKAVFASMVKLEPLRAALARFEKLNKP